MRVLGKTKKFTKTAQFWSQNVQLVPIMKIITNTLWFYPQIGVICTFTRPNCCSEPSFAMKRLPEE